MNEYILRVVLATETAVSDEAFDAFTDAAEKFSETATIARHASGQGFVVTDDWDGETDTDKLVYELVGLAYDATGGLAFGPVDIRVCSLEIYEAEALQPDIPELASAGDAAKILGVSRQRVHQLASKNSLFPKPVAHVASGPLWTRAAIKWFDSVWERKAGRPSTRVNPRDTTIKTFIKMASSVKAIQRKSGTVRGSSTSKRSTAKHPTTHQ